MFRNDVVVSVVTIAGAAAGDPITFLQLVDPTTHGPDHAGTGIPKGNRGIQLALDFPEGIDDAFLSCRGDNLLNKIRP